MLKNVTCRPGAYVEIVPLGLLGTLQYNSNGILQKIVLSFNYLDHKDEDVLDANLTIDLKQRNLVPQRINFAKGTTWVRGVFYTKKQFKSEGILPDCIREEMVFDLEHHPEDYVFYAGDIKNDSMRIAGSGLVTTRLATLGFNTLPGYQVYDELGAIPVEDIMKSKKSPFTYPLLSGLLICEGAADFRYVPFNLNQMIVTSTTNYLDNNGYLHTTVMSSNKSMNKSYTDIVQYDVQPKSTIILDDTDIVYSRPGAGFMRKRLARSIHCSICGKTLTVPVRGFTSCQDPHCVSKLYPVIQHFLSVLQLPEMSFNQFKEHMQNKEITCLTDVLILDTYKDCKVNCTLSTLLSAVVPVSFVRTAGFFQKFTNYLGSVEAFDYYIQNPDCIVTDLKLDPIPAASFCRWLKDPYNVVELETLLNSSQITIKPVAQKFEGSPIFRNKTICVTGTFQHGTLEDIIAILKSYSAEVTTKFDNTVHCVVVGHYEDEDRSITELANAYGIKVYGEDDFFRYYEIDLDIQKQRDMLDHYLK